MGRQGDKRGRGRLGRRGHRLWMGWLADGLIAGMIAGTERRNVRRNARRIGSPVLSPERSPYRSAGRSPERSLNRSAAAFTGTVVESERSSVHRINHRPLYHRRNHAALQRLSGWQISGCAQLRPSALASHDVSVVDPHTIHIPSAYRPHIICGSIAGF